jgi:neutral amino acid transport system substrate-binding protein
MGLHWQRSCALIVAAAGTACVWGPTACSSSSSGPPAGTPDAAVSVITIGMSNPRTGGLEGLGKGLQDTITVAQQQINQVGVLGMQVSFDIRDDASDATQAVAVAQQLVAEGVSGLLGPISSGEAVKVIDVTYPAKVVTISATATSPLLTSAQPQQDRYFFRTAPPDDLQGRAIVKFVRDGIAPFAADAGAPGDGGTAPMLGGTCHNTFIVNGDDAYGNALGDVVANTFKNSASMVLGRDKVPTTVQSDYMTVVNDVVSAHPDCLVLIAYSDVGAKLLRQLNAAIVADTGHDWSKFFVSGSDGEYDSKFIPNGQQDPADPKSANSTWRCYGTTADPAPDTPEFASFKDIWHQSSPGQDPPAYGANQYDAAVVLALAIHQAGTATDGTKIRDALYKVANPPGTAFGPGQFVDAVNAISKGIDIDYDGASGNCNFDSYGNVTSDYIVWQVQKQADGTFAFATVGKIKAADLPPAQ